jgi:PAS domain S-box-containing protein/putative nucleotidyltransferase with HDIG domain
VNREHLLAVLYDMAMTIGGEIDLDRLLTRTLQRLLFHTSFPAGLLFLDLPPATGDVVDAAPAAAIGDFELAACVGRPVTLPAVLLRGEAELREDPALLERLPCTVSHYSVFLRLPIEHYGVIVLLAGEPPPSDAPLVTMFRPVMENFAHAIHLCRHHALYTSGLVAERNEVRAGLERFRAAMDASGDVVMLVDPATDRFVDVNRAAERAFGYTREELLRMGPRDIDPRYTGIEVRRLLEADGAAASVHAERVFEARHRRRDGSEFEVEMRLSPFVTPDQQPLVIAIATDIGRRKLAEQALRESEEKFRLITTWAQDAIVILDDHGRVAYWNEAARRVFGFSAAEVAGRNLHELLAPAGQHDSFHAGFERFRTSGTGPFLGRTMELPAMHRDGHEFPIEISVSAVQYRGQWHAIGILRDISERKRAEGARAELASIVTSSHDAIIARDLDGRVVTWNRGAERMFGYGADEMIGRLLDRLGTDARDHEVDELFDRVKRGEEVVNFETRRRCRDGREIDVALTLSPIRDAAGALTGVSTIARDITERRRAEAALHRVNRALMTLSSCNEVLIRAVDETGLLRDMCRVITGVGGYRMAWVGVPEHDGDRRVRPVASGGHVDDFLERIRISWGDGEFGGGPVGTAIRTRQPCVVHDTQADPLFAPWRAVAAALGYHSVIALPLLDHSGGPFAVLVIYAADADAYDAEEVRLLNELAADLAFGIMTVRARVARDDALRERQLAQDRLRDSLVSTVEAIGATLEMRDPYTAGHQRRVAELAVAIARELDLPEQNVMGLHFGGLIHDIGKIQIPGEILAKPGRLTRIELEFIRSHSQAGYEVLKGIQFPWPVAQIVVQHHERIDGSGYPGGLRGDDILPEARILAVADVVEAISSHRPYRPTLGIEAALAEIGEHRGTRYDVDVVDVCVRLFRENRFAFSR